MKLFEKFLLTFLTEKNRDCTDLSKPDSQRASARDDDELVTHPKHAAVNLLVHHSVHGGEVLGAAVAVDELASVPPISPLIPPPILLLLLGLPPLDFLIKILDDIIFERPH